jgi:hypothetical protein
MSMVMGAPAAKALALGFHEPTKGTAAPTPPTALTAVVAPIKKRLRLLFAVPSLTKRLLNLPQETGEITPVKRPRAS